MGIGRPSKLTPERHAEIVGYIRDGVSLQTAGDAAGITPRCAELWRAKGERDWNAWESDEDPEVGTHAAFFREVRRAHALWEINKLKDALAGDDRGESNGVGKSAQWALAAVRGGRYQPKIQVQVETEMAVVVDVLAAVLSTEQYAEVLGALGDLDDEGIPRVLSGPVEPDDEAHTTH